MRVTVRFYSYFKDLTGCEQWVETIPAGGTIGALLQQLQSRFPKLTAMEKSTLIAVGVNYETRGYKLNEGDEVSLFPPVQGG